MLTTPRAALSSRRSTPRRGRPCGQSYSRKDRTWVESCSELSGPSSGCRAAPPEPNKESAPEQAKAKKASAVSGDVVDSEGQPVVGATILLARIQGRSKALSTQSDADGKFAFASLPSDPPNNFALVLLAVKEGFAPTGTGTTGAAGAMSRKIAKWWPKATRRHGVLSTPNEPPSKATLLPASAAMAIVFRTQAKKNGENTCTQITRLNPLMEYRSLTIPAGTAI